MSGISPPTVARVPIIRFSRTVSFGKIQRPCGTRPMPRRAISCVRKPVIGLSKKLISPAVCGKRPMIALTSVDLPAPLQPSTPTISLGAISSAICCSTGTPPYPADRFSMCSIARSPTEIDAPDLLILRDVLIGAAPHDLSSVHHPCFAFECAHEAKIVLDGQHRTVLAQPVDESHQAPRVGRPQASGQLVKQ